MEMEIKLEKNYTQLQRERRRRRYQQTVAVAAAADERSAISRMSSVESVAETITILLAFSDRTRDE